MNRYRLLSVILILYCTEQHKCSVFCAKPNSAKSFTLLKQENSKIHNDHEDSKYSIRTGRNLKTAGFNPTSDDPTKDDRPARSIPGHQRHFRLNDAHQVANYFMTGGPSKGHAHFVGSPNCQSNSDDSNIVGMSNPTDEDTETSTNENNLSTNSSDSIVGLPHIPALYRVPGIAPIVQPHSLYKPFTGRLNPIHPSSLYPTIPHIPPTNSLLRSILHPRLHPHINTLHNLPHTLVRAASLPIHGLLQARSELNRLMLPHMPLQPHMPILPHLPVLPHGMLVGSTNTALHGKNKVIPSGDLMNLRYSPVLGAPPPSYASTIPLSNTVPHHLLTYREPTGYVVRVVHHTKETLPSSPIVGSPQQPSTCIDANLNKQQDAGDFVNNEDEVANENQQLVEQDENDNA